MAIYKARSKHDNRTQPIHPSAPLFPPSVLSLHSRPLCRLLQHRSYTTHLARLTLIQLHQSAIRSYSKHSLLLRVGAPL
jgi:hypothetical protein